MASAVLQQSRTLPVLRSYLPVGPLQLDRSEGTAGNAGLSDNDSILDRGIDNCDDKESDDAAGDNVAVIDGVIVSAREHGAKRPLKQGWGFHASVYL